MLGLSLSSWALETNQQLKGPEKMPLGSHQEILVDWDLSIFNIHFSPDFPLRTYNILNPALPFPSPAFPGATQGLPFLTPNGRYTNKTTQTPLGVPLDWGYWRGALNFHTWPPIQLEEVRSFIIVITSTEGAMLRIGGKNSLGNLA